MSEKEPIIQFLKNVLDRDSVNSTLMEFLSSYHVKPEKRRNEMMQQILQLVCFCFDHFRLVVQF